jgi:hypothetical protein
MRPDWTPPPDEDVQKNIVLEPEGERLRAELTDWLEKNKIVNMMLETKGHFVEINYGPYLPERIKPVLSIYGSIYVQDEEELIRPCF